MTVLSDDEIEEKCRDGSLVIEPYDTECLNGGGYDLRLAQDTLIPARQHVLAATLERVELGDDLIGTLHVRSSLARSGIITSLALVDPGFRGQLTISMFNSGSSPFNMKKGDKIVQMSLHRLGKKTQRLYRGKYQDSQGIVERRQ